MIAILLFMVLANWLDPGSTKEAPRFTEVAQKLDARCTTDEGSECVYAYVQLLSFDPESMYLDGRILIYPPAKFAEPFGSSVQALYATDIYLDAAKVDAGPLNENLYYNQYDYIRAIDFTIDVTSQEWSTRTSDNYYPFDHYSSFIQGRVEFITDPGETDSPDDDERTVLPINVVQYSTVLPNWTVEYDTDYLNSKNTLTDIVNYQSGGDFTTVFRIERSQLTILIVALLGLIFLGGAFSMLLLIKSIMHNSKPSSLTGLVWAGSTAFTMIQTRTLMPGDPRLGVKFDLLIFYPSIAICFVSALVMLNLWMKADNVIDEA